MSGISKHLLPLVANTHEDGGWPQFQSLTILKPLQQNLDVAWAQIFNPSPGQITQSWLGAGEAARA
ncbi:hypothetical protein C0Q70_19335 [Pomacea canaliculata]|uniref:Uncharacterized protein n=1 Tax=Pomacea canaliculata TaxID=400727 RepID=A0A2T7NJ32_POMCA|nr:hypothetical protein C0Q70_19335 [Pomacea canaliculata]